MTLEVKGRVSFTQDPKFEYKEGTGTPIWRASVVSNKPRYNAQTKQQEVTADYYSLVAYGSLAEALLEQNWLRGEEAYMIGELGQYQLPPKEGEKHGERKTQIHPYVMNPIRRRMAPPPGSGWGGNQGQQAQRPPAQPQGGSAPWDPPIGEEPPF